MRCYSTTLLEQGYVREHLKSSVYDRYGISSHIMKSPSPKCYMTFWTYSDAFHRSDISLNRDLFPKLNLITVFNVIT